MKVKHFFNFFYIGNFTNFRYTLVRYLNQEFSMLLNQQFQCYNVKFPIVNRRKIPEKTFSAYSFEIFFFGNLLKTFQQYC